MLIRDKVPPRFRSHFCFALFCVPLSPWRGRLPPTKSRFRPYFENDTVTILWLGSSSRAGLALAACRFIEKIHGSFFFYRPEGARAGGGAGDGGEGCFFCLIGEQGLKHKG